VDNSAVGEYGAPFDSECSAPKLYTDNNINIFNNNQSLSTTLFCLKLIIIPRWNKVIKKIKAVKNMSTERLGKLQKWILTAAYKVIILCARTDFTLKICRNYDKTLCFWNEAMVLGFPNAGRMMHSKLLLLPVPGTPTGKKCENFISSRQRSKTLRIFFLISWQFIETCIKFCYNNL